MRGRPSLRRREPGSCRAPSGLQAGSVCPPSSPATATAPANAARVGWAKSSAPPLTRGHGARTILPTRPGPTARAFAHPTASHGMQAIDQAKMLHQMGRIAEAEAAYRSVLARDPRQFDALHLLGLLRLQQGHPREAHELISRAVEIRPRSPQALAILMAALLALGRPEQALAACDRIVAIAPRDRDALYNRGLAGAEARDRSDVACGYAKKARPQSHNVPVVRFGPIVPTHRERLRDDVGNVSARRAPPRLRRRAELSGKGGNGRCRIVSPAAKFDFAGSASAWRPPCDSSSLRPPSRQRRSSIFARAEPMRDPGAQSPISAARCPGTAACARSRCAARK